MSFRDTPEFKAAQSRMLSRSSQSMTDFQRRLLEAESAQAANAGVAEVMTTDEFINRILPEGLDATAAGDEDEASADDR